MEFYLVNNHNKFLLIIIIIMLLIIYDYVEVTENEWGRIFRGLP